MKLLKLDTVFINIDQIVLIDSENGYIHMSNGESIMVSLEVAAELTSNGSTNETTHSKKVKAEKIKLKEVNKNGKDG